MTQTADFLPSNFLLVRTSSKSKRLFEVNEVDIVLNGSTGIQRFPQREISGQVTVFPTKKGKTVHYILVANSEIPPHNDQHYSLRIISDNPIKVVELPELFL